MFRTAVLLALASALLWRASAGADDDFIAAYNLIQQSDTFRETGQVSSARRGYGEALSRLRDLQRSYPTWNERVIAYRLRYVTEKLGALPETPAAAALPAGSDATPTVAATVRDPSELAPSGEVITQFNTLNTQITQLATEKKLLEAKLREALTAQPVPIDPRELQQAVERIGALQVTNKVLLASLEQQQAERKNLVDKVVAEEAQKALNEANRQLLAQKSGAAALAKEKTDLEAALKRLQEGDLKQLKGENSTLKSQVNELRSETERGKLVADLSARLGKLQIKLDDTAKQNGQLLADKAKLEKQVDDLRARQSEESIVRFNKLETDLAVARADAGRNAAKAEDIAVALDKEKSARGQLEQDNRTLTSRVTVLTGQLTAAKALEAALAAEKTERAEVEAQLKTAEERLAATRLAAPTVAKTGGAIAEPPSAGDAALTAQLRLLEGETTRLRGSLRDSHARETELKTLVAEADGQRIRLEQDKTVLMKRLALAEQAAAATPSAKDGRIIRTLEAKVRELEQQRDTLAKKLAAASRRVGTQLAAARSSRLGSPRDRVVEFYQER
ncbi:MAG: hypothetical protein WCP53_13915 [Verrucomicrobiota bacterium]